MTEPLLAYTPRAPSPFDAAQALAGGLVNTLRLARVMAEARRPIDLSGFDAQVGLLCAKALDLPPDQGRILSAALAALLGEADTLHASLTRLAAPPNSGG